MGTPTVPATPTAPADPPAPFDLPGPSQLPAPSDPPGPSDPAGPSDDAPLRAKLRLIRVREGYRTADGENSFRAKVREEARLLSAAVSYSEPQL